MPEASSPVTRPASLTATALVAPAIAVTRATEELASERLSICALANARPDPPGPATSVPWSPQPAASIAATSVHASSCARVMEVLLGQGGGRLGSVSRKTAAPRRSCARTQDSAAPESRGRATICYLRWLQKPVQNTPWPAVPAAING